MPNPIPQLLNARYYDDTKFFELLDGSGSGGRLVRGGIQSNPAIGKAWRKRPVADDPWSGVPSPIIRKGMVALSPPQDDRNSGRSTQFVIQLSDTDENFDSGRGSGVPIGEVVSGIEVLEAMVDQHSTDAISGYSIDKIYELGDKFLSRYDSDLPYIHSARYNTKRKQQELTAGSATAGNGHLAHSKREL